jgi:hypothetical protein|tara:strand:+ start:211 stop:933 length:723 start_codon:yes stop_codon:yes gene_type:complete
MARIASYPIQNIIIGSDKVIGTDALNTGATKNFTFDEVAIFLNTNSKIELNALRYKYQNWKTGEVRKSGTISFANSDAGTPAFSSISTFVLSARQLNSIINISSYYTVPLVGSSVLISQVDNPSIFGIYTWNSSVVKPLEGGFFNIGVTYAAGASNLEKNKDYFISLLTYAPTSGGDKNYVFTQPTNANPWVVNHGLNKYAAVSVSSSANEVVYADVQYDSLNQVTITFNSPTNGKAFFN